MINKIKTAVSIIHTSCLDRGFRPNYGPGETAVLHDLRGPGSPAIREHLYVDCQSSICFDTDLDLHVSVVNQYVHLGRVTAKDSNMSPEIAHWSMSHNMALGPLRKAVFRNPVLDQDQKKIFSDALAASRLWYNAATWQRLTACQLQNLDRQLFKRFALLSGIAWTSRECSNSTAQIMAKVRELLAGLYLCIARLHYLFDFSSLPQIFLLLSFKPLPISKQPSRSF